MHKFGSSFKWLKKSLYVAAIMGGVTITVNSQDAKDKKQEKITCPGSELPFPRQEPLYNGKVTRIFSAFETALQRFEPRAAAVEKMVAGKTIPELQELMKSQKLSSVDLVLHYLGRIKKYDIDKLNSVMELNPDALSIAAALDKERMAGKVIGPMHGIPVLLKDNIATKDNMHTTAGAAAMLGWRPGRDAFLAGQLRKAGAIILGKANLSEWANYMDPCMPSGFSTNGGQTRNPYGSYDTYGSSSGSAVSVAADLVTVSVGSETQGSIIMPAYINSVVGLKTSMGLVSRDYVIPLLGFQDVPGPIGRTVTDVAVMLSAMVGNDANDAASARATALSATNFSQYANLAAVKGIKVCIPIRTQKETEEFMATLKTLSEERIALVKQQLKAEDEAAHKWGKLLSDAGITVVEIPMSDVPKRQPDITKTLQYGFKEDLNLFLKSLGAAAPVSTLEAIIAFNKQDLKNRAPYGQGHLENANNTKITAQEFAELRSNNIEMAQKGIDGLLAKYGVDVVMSSVNQVYAPAGYPAITIPSGYNDNGAPTSVVFVGSYLSEPALIAVGYAFEQAAKARKNPDLDKAMQLINDIKRIEY